MIIGESAREADMEVGSRKKHELGNPSTRMGTVVRLGALMTLPTHSASATWMNLRTKGRWCLTKPRHSASGCMLLYRTSVRAKMVKPKAIMLCRPVLPSRRMLRIVLVLQVNPVREKKLTNIRTTAADEKVFLTPPRALTLEDAIGGPTRNDALQKNVSGIPSDSSCDAGHGEQDH